MFPKSYCAYQATCKLGENGMHTALREVLSSLVYIAGGIWLARTFGLAAITISLDLAVVMFVFDVIACLHPPATDSRLARGCRTRFLGMLVTVSAATASIAGRLALQQAGQGSAFLLFGLLIMLNAAAICGEFSLELTLNLTADSVPAKKWPS